MDETGNGLLLVEFCHFDGSHKGVKSSATLTASVYL